MSEEVQRFSDAALAKQAAMREKDARGERITWSDLAGAWEPNPALPDCQSWDVHSDVKCMLPNHHEGEHRAEVTW